MTAIWEGRSGAEPGDAVAGARPVDRVLKRGLDLVVATVVLTACLPVLLVVALLVRATSRGPVLFRQVRVGLDGRPFGMLKFRTMLAGADESVHREYVEKMLTDGVEPQNGLYKLGADPRVTRVGAVLRRSSIDEMPQLLNVIRGEMSLVGPRPALPWEARMFPDWAAPRFSVRPGLTGMWQVSGRNRVTMIDGLRLDVDYVARRNIGLDLVILLRTVPAVLGGGAR